MGVERPFHGYVNVAASGPLQPHEWSQMTEGMRPRMMADLKFTTADTHYLANMWPLQHPQLAGKSQTHAFINHPTLSEFYDVVDEVLEDLEAQEGCGDWSDIALTLTFAGHGEDTSGGLVVSDGRIEAEDLVEHLRARAPRTVTKGIRVGLMLDSCFSGEFLIRFLEQTWADSTVLPEYCFASAMFDEVAWEDPGLGHGVGTYCFSVREPLGGGLVSKAIQPDNSWGTALAAVSGFHGVAFLTLGRQHAIQADPFGEIRTTLGSVPYGYMDNDQLRVSNAVRPGLQRLRDEANEMIDKLSPDRSVVNVRSNRDVRELLPALDELVQLQCNTEREGDADVATQAIPDVRVLRWADFVPQPWMLTVK